jgi:hypothetical protein
MMNSFKVSFATLPAFRCPTQQITAHQAALVIAPMTLRWQGQYEIQR